MLEKLKTYTEANTLEELKSLTYRDLLKCDLTDAERRKLSTCHTKMRQRLINDFEQKKEELAMQKMASDFLASAAEITEEEAIELAKTLFILRKEGLVDGVYRSSL